MVDSQLFPGMSVATFKAEYYRRRPLLVRGAAEALLGRRFDQADFARWRCAMQAHHTAYLRGDGEHMSAVLRASTVDDELGLAAARQGQHFPDVACDIDAFSTGVEPGGSVGAHFDDNDNFIVQQRGQKRWRLAAPEHVQPRDLHARACLGMRIGHAVMPDEQLDLVLSPGDVLYVPSFWVHWGTGLGESLSVSLALNPFDTGSWLRAHTLWPRIERYVQRALPEVARCDPSAALQQLHRFTHAVVPGSAPVWLDGQDACALAQRAARRRLARLLVQTALLGDRPLPASIAADFPCAVASLATLPHELLHTFTFGNLFAAWCERTLEAVAFADPYQLAELGQLLIDWVAQVYATRSVEPAPLLDLARGVHALRELEQAQLLIANWRALAAREPALAALGELALPVRAKPPADTRAQLAWDLRLGSAAADEPAATTLLRWLGRAALEESPDSMELAARLLPTLSSDELCALAAARTLTVRPADP